MAKSTRKHVALENFEKKAQEFISLSFSYCEAESQSCRRLQPRSILSKNTALVAATLAVQESIKTLMAAARIERE